MKVGDLVKYRSPTKVNEGKVFLVSEIWGKWIRLLGRHGLKSPAKFEVISEP